MTECPVCGQDTVSRTLSGEEGNLLYKYYSESDTVEHYDRYRLVCGECVSCGKRCMPRAEGLDEGTLKRLTDALDGEGYVYDKCPECGGRLIKEMAGMGSSGNLLKMFAEEDFTYSFALFDMCADCGRISDIREKLMGV